MQRRDRGRHYCLAFRRGQRPPGIASPPAGASGAMPCGCRGGNGEPEYVGDRDAEDGLSDALGESRARCGGGGGEQGEKKQESRESSGHVTTAGLGRGPRWGGRAGRRGGGGTPPAP